MAESRLVRIRRVDFQGNQSLDRIPFSEALRPKFMEDILYSKEVPYSVVLQTFSRPMTSSLHYGQTMEVMIAQNLKGYVIVAGRRYQMDGSPVAYVILPGVLHAAFLEPKEDVGTIHSLKFSFPYMNSIVNLETLLSLQGYTLEDLSQSKPDFSKLSAQVQRLAEVDSDVFGRTACCLEIFRILCDGIPPKSQRVPSSGHTTDEDLNRLIGWTQEHLHEPITLDDAAKFMKMSKYYFCKYFKQKTCTTYLQFLTQLRIDYASRLLCSGVGATECCYACGFESVPYFVQLFKHMTGMTTRDFRKLYGQNSELNREIR